MRYRAHARIVAALFLVSAVAASGLLVRPSAASYSSADSSAADSTKVKQKAKARSKAKGKAKTKRAEAMMETKTAPGTMPVKPDPVPEHIQVQHILIGFAGSVPGKNVSRTQEQANMLAYQILDRARKGESFDDLVRQYTGDSPPGIYGMSGMSGMGVASLPGEFPRGRMVPSFGNVGFAMSPGNISIADYDPSSSPYGWHVIKRLK